jgi:pSer/pThr/pTyr-binding forkhead associated (FHA) protein
MKISCDNCHTIYEIEREQIGKLACPYCEHMNVPGAVATGLTATARAAERQDHSKTMIGPMDGLPGSETTLIQRMLNGRTAGLPPAHEAALVVLDGDGKGNRYPLTQIETVLGRKEGDIRLTDSEVSRKHCRVRLYCDLALVTDIGSANGTRVKEHYVREGVIKPQETFQIGTTVFQFILTPK